jgi:hypothetical protein
MALSSTVQGGMPVVEPVKTSETVEVALHWQEVVPEGRPVAHFDPTSRAVSMPSMNHTKLMMLAVTCPYAACVSPFRVA